MSRKRQEQAARRAELEAMKSRRRFVLGAGAVVAAGAAGYGLFAITSMPPSASATLDWDPAETIYDTDVVYGSADAPVTVVEFASMTCVHCIRFHRESLPGFLKGWVDTGKARLVLRHFPFDGAALAVAGLVSCLDEGSRPGAVTALIRHRDRWTNVVDPAAEAIGMLSLSAGERSRVQRCIADGKMQEKLAEPLTQARRGGISSTPSFVVNQKLYPGFMSADKLGAIVDAAI